MGDLTTAIDFETLEFRKANPHFREKPATLEEFLGPGYLNLGDTVRPAIREVLKDVFGEDVETQNPSHYMRAFSRAASASARRSPSRPQSRPRRAGASWVTSSLGTRSSGLTDGQPPSLASSLRVNDPSTAS